MPLDIIRRPRREKDRRAADIGGVAPASRRDTLDDLTVARLVALQRGGVVRRDIAGRDRIDLNALRRPFVGEQPGQAADPRFRRGIARYAAAAPKGPHRGEVDDPARPPLLLATPLGSLPRRAKGWE